MRRSINVYKAYLTLGAKVYVTNRVRSRIFIQKLNQLLRNTGQQLSRQQVNRIQQYTTQSCITNSWFSALRGYRPDTLETQRALYLGAFTPIYDDLMDQHSYSHEKLMETIRQDNLPTNADLLLLKKLYDTLMGIIDNPTTFEKCLVLTGKSQNQSTKQHNKEKIDNEILWKITADKGGHATLLYRSILNNPLLPGEQKAIYVLGSILQLTNDLFDMYKDHQNGFQTLATNTSSFTSIKTLFLKTTEQTISLFYALDYPRKNIHQAVDQMLSVVSRGMVCLDQFVSIQEKENGLFDISTLSRETLICDMEKISNIKKSLAWLSQYPIPQF